MRVTNLTKRYGDTVAVDDLTFSIRPGVVTGFGDERQELLARFDPGTGLLSSLESMRYKGTDSEGPTLWINEVDEWGAPGGHPAPLVASITWHDEGSPWAVLRTEEVLYDVDLADDLGGRGP